MLRYNIPLFLLLTGLLPAQNAPSWYIDKELEYPGSSYIAAVGEGKTRIEAETAAAAQVSLFFNTITQVRNEAIREFNSAVQNNTTEFSRKTYISESAVIKSEEEFLGLRFVNAWQDQKRGVWAVLAYIDRREAALMYDSKITAAMDAINALASDAERESEILYACALLRRALALCDITGEYIKNAAAIDAGKTYETQTAKIQAVRSAYRTKRNALSFSVTVRSPENSGRIERRLNSLLEDSGFAVSPDRALYTLTARISMEEEISSGGTYFVTPGITIRVEREGKTLFSYSKTYERASSRSAMNSAYTRGLMEMEEDLEGNFINKFTAMLGR